MKMNLGKIVHYDRFNYFLFVYLNLALNYIGLPSLHSRLLLYAVITLIYLNLLYLKVKKVKLSQ
jgi:hypothetical protein